MKKQRSTPRIEGDTEGLITILTTCNFVLLGSCYNTELIYMLQVTMIQVQP
jgi:hypothetical protein